jgi:hypothetical protein
MRWARGNDNFVYSSLWDFKTFLHAVKSYDMGPSLFISYPRERCAANFIALKNPSPWPGFEPANFGSSAKHTNHYTTKAKCGRLLSKWILNEK